jgi:hypothetical protein
MRRSHPVRGWPRRLPLALATFAASIWLAPAAQAQVVLTDVSARVGAPPPSQSYSVAPGDWNGDGVNDHVLFVQHSGGPALLYQINANGTLTLVQSLDRRVVNKRGLTTTHEVDRHTCRWADFNLDGLQDAYCSLGASNSGPAKSNELWLGQPGGTLALVPAVTNPGDHTLDYAMGAGDPWGRGRGVAVADYNHDGWPDLFLTADHPRSDRVPTPDRLFLNLGDDAKGRWLGFADAPSWGVDVEEGSRGCDFPTDFNNDGLPDIVFCGSKTLTFYQNTGTGFTNVTSTLLGARMFAADAKIATVNGQQALVYVRLSSWGIRYRKPDGSFQRPGISHPLTAGRAIEVVPSGIYVLQGNGVPGCRDAKPTAPKYCPTNYPDYFYPTTGTGLGSPVTVNAAGHGDDVVALSPTRLWVSNGADLDRGPTQILNISP